MARLNADIKLGYYPASTELIERVARHIEPCDGMSLVDPCAGEGLAVRLLADRLGVPLSRVAACELDTQRSRELEGNLPGAVVSGVCDALSAIGPYRSVSMVYCNPPFTDELGHSDRTESLFLSRAASMLIDDGLLVFIAQRRRVASGILRDQFSQNFYDVESMDVPGCPFGSCVVFGYKRRRSLVSSEAKWGFLREENLRSRYTTLPGEVGFFRKVEYTDQELERLLDTAGAVRYMLGSGESGRVVRPPLELGDGHRALLLAAGYLNGRVHKPGKIPHVVRGTSRKKEVEVSSVVSGGKRTVVTEEQIELVIRTVDAEGNIQEITG